MVRHCSRDLTLILQACQVQFAACPRHFSNTSQASPASSPTKSSGWRKQFQQHGQEVLVIIKHSMLFLSDNIFPVSLSLSLSLSLCLPVSLRTFVAFLASRAFRITQVLVLVFAHMFRRAVRRTDADDCHATIMDRRPQTRSGKQDLN